MPLPLDAPAEDVDADAVLLIGDRAMRACLPGFALRLRPRPGVARLDRAAVRLRRLGRARRASTSGDVDGAFARGEAARAGPRRRRSPHREAPALGLDAGFCRRYLRNIIHFDLGPRELAGLHQLLRAGAAELGPGAREGVAPCPLPSTASCRKPLTASRLTLRRGRRAVRLPRPARARPGRRTPSADAAAPRAVPHLQHRPQHQLHERLRRRLRLLRLLPQVGRRRRLRPAARGAVPEDRGDDRPRRRPDPDAGRHPPVAEAGVVRGAAPRPARPAIPTVNLHAFSPPEIWHFHKLNKLPLRDGAASG